MPTLSALTPSFNYAWCIEDALNSVAELRRTPQAAGMSSTSWSTMIHMTVALRLQDWDSRSLVRS
jgi:hypothetical protein